MTAKTRNNSSRSWRRGCAALLAASALLAGCDDSRLPISGRVTLDGTPLDGAEIVFIPLHAGPKSGAAIVAGQYAIDAYDGLSPGDYRVEISPASAPDFASPARPSSQSPRDRAAAQAHRANSIEPCYNSRSELTVVVSNKVRRFDFALRSRPKR